MFFILITYNLNSFFFFSKWLESTNANKTSSRSHAILQVIIEYNDKIEGMGNEIKIGKLSLIDLAGSERGTYLIYDLFFNYFFFFFQNVYAFYTY